jgi:SAM-dependent methyltransferase
MKGSENSPPPADEFYNELGEGYELMINWDARLAREGPFFRKLFEEHRVKSVLDCACGTGRHAVEFARWGHSVSGCDISREMLLLAERNAAAAGVDVAFFAAGLTEIARKARGRKFDAVVCLGNSLPHLLTQRELDQAMRSIRRVLTAGGVFVVQIRNYDRIVHENLRFMPPTSAKQGDREVIFFRMLDIHGPRRIDFNIIQFSREADTWRHTVQTTRLRPMLKPHLETALGRAAFSEIRHYADYGFTPFDTSATLDLITVAR